MYINKLRFACEWPLVNVERVMEMENYHWADTIDVEGYLCDLGIPPQNSKHTGKTGKEA